VTHVIENERDMTTVLLVRHGMTDAVGHRIVGWTPGVGLNGLGVEQAAKLGAELACTELDAIYSSPLERAMLTAEAIRAHQRCAITQREGLGEVHFGEWTGQTLEELDSDERWRRWNSIRTTARAPGGETMLAVQRRMLDELSLAQEQYPEGTVALVSHADPIRSLLVYLLGMSMDVFLRLRVDPASVSIVRVTGWSLEVGGVNLHAGGVGAQLRAGPLVEHRRPS
jgi:probable phosphoglycerate mutase